MTLVCSWFRFAGNVRFCQRTPIDAALSPTDRQLAHFVSRRTTTLSLVRDCSFFRLRLARSRRWTMLNLETRHVFLITCDYLEKGGQPGNSLSRHFSGCKVKMDQARLRNGYSYICCICVGSMSPFLYSFFVSVREWSFGTFETIGIVIFFRDLIIPFRNTVRAFVGSLGKRYI